MNAIKGDRIEESLKLSDLIIFISTFVYRESIRRFEIVTLVAAAVVVVFPFQNDINPNDIKRISALFHNFAFYMCCLIAPIYSI